MATVRILSFLVLQFFVNVKCLSKIDPLVHTKVGSIRGLSANDGDYAMFLGIPYAKVDENNPFGEATPHPNFTEIFEAHDDSAICPQVFELNNTILGTIDCLQLSVYVPTSATPKNRLPVMVWIYGGAFHQGVFGKYFYTPTYLVKHDVIVVTLNYRVGAYGFMCLDIPEVPGNQGLKDQYLALKWIKDNIKAFGGDADNITLFGNSAGGHCVDLLLISEKENLFNKIIIQSGSSLSASMFIDPDREAPLKIAKSLGFETSNFSEAILFLANSDPKNVVAVAIELDITFKPCVEKQFESVEPFIQKSWIHETIPKVKDVPVLIGFNEHEITALHLNKDLEYYKNLDILSDHFNKFFNLNVEDVEELKDILMNFYFGDREMSKDIQLEIGNLSSDINYILVHPIQRTIQKYLEGGAEKIYYYMFSYIGGRNGFKIYDEKTGNLTCCASHADEVAYIFDMSFKGELTEEDNIVMERMTKMWTNFAKFSDPTPDTSDILPIKWTPLTKEEFTFMNIGAELSLDSRPAHSRMAIWHLFYKQYKHLQKLFAN